MSKLTIVRDALQANPDVLIANVEERTYLPEPNGFWTQTMKFVVAPTKGLYTAESLQSFMMGLVPLEGSSKVDFRSWPLGQILVPLEATSKVDFRSWPLGQMMFGMLAFDETIGTDTTVQTIVISDPDVQLPDSYVNGRLTINEGGATSQDLRRRTWVKVYPDRDYAQRAMKGEDTYSTDNLRIQGIAFRRNLNRLVKAIGNKR